MRSTAEMSTQHCRGGSGGREGLCQQSLGRKKGVWQGGGAQARWMVISRCSPRQPGSATWARLTHRPQVSLRRGLQPLLLIGTGRRGPRAQPRLLPLGAHSQVRTSHQSHGAWATRERCWGLQEYPMGTPTRGRGPGDALPSRAPPGVAQAPRVQGWPRSGRVPPKAGMGSTTAARTSTAHHPSAATSPPSRHRKWDKGQGRRCQPGASSMAARRGCPYRSPDARPARLWEHPAAQGAPCRAHSVPSLQAGGGSRTRVRPEHPRCPASELWFWNLPPPPGPLGRQKAVLRATGLFPKRHLQSPSDCNQSH